MKKTLIFPIILFAILSCKKETSIIDEEDVIERISFIELIPEDTSESSLDFVKKTVFSYNSLNKIDTIKYYYYKYGLESSKILDKEIIVTYPNANKVLFKPKYYGYKDDLISQAIEFENGKLKNIKTESDDVSFPYNIVSLINYDRDSEGKLLKCLSQTDPDGSKTNGYHQFIFNNGLLEKFQGFPMDTALANYYNYDELKFQFQYTPFPKIKSSSTFNIFNTLSSTWNPFYNDIILGLPELNLFGSKQNQLITKTTITGKSMDSPNIDYYHEFNYKFDEKGRVIDYTGTTYIKDSSPYKWFHYKINYL
jgi:hypothetical protein